MAVGIVGLLGWYLQIPALVRVAPGFVAMQYNAAVLCVAAGIALRASLWGHRRSAAALAVAVIVVAGLSFIEHLRGVDFGLDQLLWRLGVDRDAMGELAHLRQSAPGRMAPNTAIGFVLLGLALLAVPWRRASRPLLMAAAAAAMLASMIGGVALSGYLIGIPSAYGWGHLTRMALLTSMALSLLGIGTVSAIMLGGLRTGIQMRRWPPLISGAVAALCTLTMWQALVDHDHRTVVQIIQRQGEEIVRELAHGIDDRALAIDRQARRWTGGTPRERPAWMLASQLLQRDYSGLEQLAWVDALGQVRWSVPESLPLGGQASSALTAAQRGSVSASSRVSASSAVQRIQDDWVTVLTAPLREGSAARGHLVAVLSLRTLMAELLNTELAGAYSVTLRHGSTVLYARHKLDEAGATEWEATAAVPGRVAGLSVAVLPTRPMLAGMTSAVPTLFLATGLLTSLLIGWIVAVASTSRARARRLSRVVTELATENESRRRAEQILAEHAEELATQGAELERQNDRLHTGAQELLEQRDALERAEEFLTALVRSVAAGVAAFDPEGTVIAWNPAMEALSGIPASHATGQSIGGLLAFMPNDAEVEALTVALDVALEGEPTQIYDVKLTDVAKGHESWLDLAVTPMHAADGQLIGGLLVARDTTQRKRAKDLILAGRTAAEEANRAKSDFLARMSHELRTPLNSVIGFTNVLLRNRDRRLDHDDIKFLGRIGANGRHLLNLINEVLDLSKIEAGHETVQPSSVAIDQLILETVGELEVRGTEGRIQLHAIMPDRLVEGVTDPAKLKQVLINLLGNAVKFTPPEGRVTVRLHADDAGVPTHIEVEDTGIGIPADRLDAIFEAFEQADEQTSRRYGGTGLGLAISRKLCELMGYDLLVRSQLGAGSVFTVVLNRADQVEDVSAA